MAALIAGILTTFTVTTSCGILPAGLGRDINKPACSSDNHG